MEPSNYLFVLNSFLLVYQFITKCSLLVHFKAYTLPIHVHNGLPT